MDDLVASLRLVLPDASDLQLRTAVTLVRTVVEQGWLEEQARVRDLASARKRRQRSMSRDSHGDSHVTVTGQALQVIAPARMIPHTKPPPPIASSPPSSDGGFGGSVSSDPGLLRLSGDPEPLEARSLRRGKVMNPPAYTPEFEAMWGATDRVGSKSVALAAWEQVGKPGADVIGPAWAAWVAFWAGIGVKHVSTWLRDFDWQQAPARASASTPQAPRNFRAETNRAAVAGFLNFVKGRQP